MELSPDTRLVGVGVATPDYLVNGCTLPITSGVTLTNPSGGRAPIYTPAHQLKERTTKF